MRTTPLAVFFQFQTVFERLLVFCSVIIDAVAIRAFQANEIVLRH